MWQACCRRLWRERLLISLNTLLSRLPQSCCLMVQKISTSSRFIEHFSFPSWGILASFGGCSLQIRMVHDTLMYAINGQDYSDAFARPVSRSWLSLVYILLSSAQKRTRQSPELGEWFTVPARVFEKAHVWVVKAVTIGKVYLRTYAVQPVLQLRPLHVGCIGVRPDVPLGATQLSRLQFRLAPGPCAAVLTRS